MGNTAYDKANTRFVGLKFNKTTDADIIAFLAMQPNMQGYLKQLIRADMAARGLAPRTDADAFDDEEE